MQGSQQELGRRGETAASAPGRELGGWGPSTWPPPFLQGAELQLRSPKSLLLTGRPPSPSPQTMSWGRGHRLTVAQWWPSEGASRGPGSKPTRLWFFRLR